MTLREFDFALAELRSSARTDDPASIEARAMELLQSVSLVDDITPDNKSEFSDLQCELLTRLSTLCRDRNALDEALNYAQSAIAIAEESNLQPSLAVAYRLAGEAYSRKHENADALNSFKKAFQLQEGLENKRGMAMIARELGILFNRTSEYVQALEYSHQSLALYEELADEIMQATVLADIGIIYYGLSDNMKAIEFMNNAVDLFSKHSKTDSVAKHTGNIGNVYWSLGNYTKALEYMLRSLSMAEEHGLTTTIAYNTANIGRVYSSLGDFDNALNYTGRALEIFEELNDKKAIAFFMTANATTFIQINDYAKAYDWSMRALAMSEEAGDIGIAASNMLNLGSLYYTEGFEQYDTSIAEDFLLRALEHAVTCGDKGLQSKVHEALTEYLQTQMRWEEALKHYMHYHELEREVQSDEATKHSLQLDNRRKIEESERDRQVKLARFQEQEKILHNILPPKIAERVVNGERRIVQQFDNVSVLFADIVGFTTLSQQLSADSLVDVLDTIFNSFDQLSDKHGCEKIKTIGDCYMVVAGLPEQSETHATQIAELALDMMDLMKICKTPTDNEINIRIGIHAGPVVAGILGKNKYAYDLWGDAVNTASRMETHGEAGRVHVSEAFMQEITAKANTVRFEERGELDIKGKGKMRTYFLERA